MSRQLLSRHVFVDSDQAIDAIESVGFTYDRRLDLVDDDPQIGKTYRFFGILGNILRPLDVKDKIVVTRLLRLLEDDDNRVVKKKLTEGRLDFTPVSKVTAAKINDDLASRKLHLPWAFTPMNADLAVRVERLNRAGQLTMNVFYSQVIQLDTTAAPTVQLGRLFSLPVGVDSKGTWLQPIYDDLLDEDVGLVIEADVR